jgi:hypothetical protein
MDMTKKKYENMTDQEKLCDNYNCHNGFILVDWCGASANDLKAAGIYPCPSCNKDAWDKIPKEIK